MDPTLTRLARDLASAIAAAVAADPKVDACRAEAREAGYELRLSIEAVVGFASTVPSASAPASSVAPPTLVASRPAPPQMTASDRRFLRSLRIAPDVGADGSSASAESAD